MSLFQPLDEPERKSLGQLIELAEHGDLGIPDFQRDFVWGRPDILEFFESIFRGYYVGSLLFWANSRILDMDNKPVYGTKPPGNFNPRYIVLDGQQRVSSLYYATRAPEVPLWNTKYPYLFFVDLRKLLAFLDEQGEDAEDERLILSLTKVQSERRGIVGRDNQFRNWYFPLSALVDFNDWVYDFSNYLQDDEGKSREDVKRITETIRGHLNYVLKEFQIPVIRLSEKLELENVAKVFEKLNTMGVELTTFDLLNARMIKHGIRARRLWNISRQKYELIREFSEDNVKFPVYVLQTIALLRRTSTKGKDLLKLDPNNYESDWERACNNIEVALKRIMLTREDGYGVLSPKRLPYLTMIPVLSSLLSALEDRNDLPNCVEKIGHWYWSSILVHAYGGSTDTQVAADFKAVTRWFSDDSAIPTSVVEARASLFEITDLSDVTSPSDALHRGMMCIITLKGGKDFVKTQIVDLSTLDVHHIFPESRASEFKAGAEINSILNKTLLERDTNRDYIRDSKPSEYIHRIMSEQGIGQDEMKRRLQTHLIPTNAFLSMLEDDFGSFLKHRDETLKNELKSLIGL